MRRRIAVTPILVVPTSAVWARCPLREQTMIRMVVNPRKQTQVDGFKFGGVVLVVLFHQPPRLLVAVHAPNPQVEIRLDLLANLQSTQDVLKFVGNRLELPTPYQQQVNLLVGRRGRNVMLDKVFVQDSGIERLAIPVHNHIRFIEKRVNAAQHAFHAALVNGIEMNLPFPVPLGCVAYGVTFLNNLI